MASKTLVHCGVYFRKLLKDCHARKSITATEILEGEKRLQAKNDTRWNSELNGIKSILSVPEDKLNLLETSHLTAFERKMLEDLVKILSPCQEAINLTQGHNVITSSFVIPCVRGLRKSFQLLSLAYNSKMVNTLTKSIENRLSKYEDDDRFNFATTLDPRFKLKWCNDEEERKLMKTKLLHAVKEKQSAEKVKDTPCDSEPHPPPAKKKMSSQLLQLLFDVDDSIANNEVHPTVDELSSYLSSCLDETEDPLRFWKANTLTYPWLSTLAKQYLSVPASSGPVERLFSIGGKVFRPDRCRLTDTKFEKLMNIKCKSFVNAYTCI